MILYLSLDVLCMEMRVNIADFIHIITLKGDYYLYRNMTS